jgi:hypothetical protein
MKSREFKLTKRQQQVAKDAIVEKANDIGQTDQRQLFLPFNDN